MSIFNIIISIIGVVIAGYLMRKYIRYTYEEGIKAGFKMHRGVSKGESIYRVQKKYDRYKKGGGC